MKEENNSAHAGNEHPSRQHQAGRPKSADQTGHADTQAVPGDEEIIEGLRRRDERITRDYFYGYCRVAFLVYMRRYEWLRNGAIDFYSIAHEYYLSLDKHQFKQLEDRKPSMSLRTWMVNGFRYILLDHIKAYKLEHSRQTFDERVAVGESKFDMPDDNFSQDFRDTVDDICNHVTDRSAYILRMMLIEGFKGKEVAAQLHITPSAVFQQYHHLIEDVLTPYFQHVCAPLPKRSSRLSEASPAFCVPSVSYSLSMSSDSSEMPDSALSEADEAAPGIRKCRKVSRSPSRRPGVAAFFTPEHITRLWSPTDVFVFGTDLGGHHMGEGGQTALRLFGAELGNGDGLQGQSYAIPTMQGGPSTIKPYVDKFIGYARQHPSQVFYVTAIGCGLSGFTPDDIAPLFKDALPLRNIRMPRSFMRALFNVL